MVIILPHVSAGRFEYCLVNKIFILVFYPPSIISLVRHWYFLVVWFLVIYAYLPQNVISHLSTIFHHCRGQKWIHIRTCVFMIKTGRKLGIGLVNLPCILLPEIVNCFDFAFEDLESWLHTLATVALESTDIELSEFSLAVGTHDKSIRHRFHFHPVHRLQEQTSTFW